MSDTSPGEPRGSSPRFYLHLLAFVSLLCWWNLLHFHFERPVPSVLRINTPRPCLCQPIFQPHAHRPEGWQLVIHRPLVVAAFDGAYFGTRD